MFLLLDCNQLLITNDNKILQEMEGKLIWTIWYNLRMRFLLFKTYQISLRWWIKWHLVLCMKGLEWMSLDIPRRGWYSSDSPWSSNMQDWQGYSFNRCRYILVYKLYETGIVRVWDTWNIRFWVYIILHDNFRNVPSIVIFRKSGKCLRLTQFSKCVKIMHNSFSADFGPLGFSIFLIYIKFAKTWYILCPNLRESILALWRACGLCLGDWKCRKGTL